MLVLDRRTALLGGLLVLGFRCAGARAAGSASGVVEGFYKVLLDVMKQATSLGFEGRYRRLQPAIEAAYDLPLMIRLAIGPPWNSLTPDQQKRLLEAFRRFTISTYAGRFDGYDGERFEIRGEVPAQNGAVLVQTRLVQTKDEPVELNYLLHPVDGSWRIIDVFLSGTISELATRRAEFTSVLRRDGADGLVTVIEHKVAELKPR